MLEVLGIVRSVDVDPRDRILDAVSERPEVCFALLFGSRANGGARDDSDWDVAVYLDDALDARARFRLRCELTAALQPAVPADIVVLNDADALLRQRALEGERLLVRDAVLFTRFFVRTMGEAEDERYFRRIHSEARRVRLLAQGGERG